MIFPVMIVLTIYIEHLSKDWKSPVYAFYKPLPKVVNIKANNATSSYVLHVDAPTKAGITLIPKTDLQWAV